MNDHLAEVNQDPGVISSALVRLELNARLDQLILNLVGKCLDVSVGRARADNEIVYNVNFRCDGNDFYVDSLFIIENGSRRLCDVLNLGFAQIA